MKSLQYIFAGFFGVLVIAVAVYGAVRLAPGVLNRFASPTPSPVASPSPTPTPVPSSPTVPYTPAKTYTPTGTVKGASTRVVTTSTTTTHLTLTLVKTSDCASSYMTEIKDITGPLTIKYSLKDGYSANVTAWKSNGEEVIPQTQISGSGTLKTISGLDYLKLQTQPANCSNTSDTWLTLTAER